MKIGFVLDDSLDKTDGVQQYVLALGRWLSEKGHEVHYLVGESHRNDLAHVHSLSKNIQVHFNENRMSTPLPANRRKIKNLLNDVDFDVLHVQMPYSPFLAGRIIKLASKKTAIVGTFHIIPYSWPERLGMFVLGNFMRKNQKRIDRIFAVSAPANKHAKKMSHAKTIILPNVIDNSKFTQAKPFKKYDDGKVNIVFLGRLVERKGCFLLLKTLDKLHRAKMLTNVRVLICGKGPLRRELEDFVYKNKLGSVVHFKGFISEHDKPKILAGAQIAVFPSTGGESFGIVLLEAMAAGSEVVLAGNNRGYKWVLGKNKDQLFNPRDVNKFAAILRHYILNARARQNALKWQKPYVKQFDVNLIGPELLVYYNQAIANRSLN